MKLRLLISIAITMALVGVPTSSAISPNGVDLFRGAWSGTINDLFNPDEALQLNLYFNEFGPDPYNPDDPDTAVASGGISITMPSKKRPKVDIGPMMARYQDLGDGEFDLTVYGTAAANNQTFVIKLEGRVKTLGSGLRDDIAYGSWQTDFGHGEWSCAHLDRRRVKVPEITPEPPPGFYFNVDAISGLWGPPGPPTSRSPRTIFNIDTNIVSANVRVDFPTGGYIIVGFFTDIFSSDVDFINTFRFYDNRTEGLPVAGGTYTFTALDILENPIPGVQEIDIYIGGNEPDPPINVKAEVVDKGILVSWDPVPVIPGAFDPEGDPPIGGYLVSVNSSYGAAIIHTTSYVIPNSRDDFGPLDRGSPLSELPDGDYFIELRSNSYAPMGSGGKGMESHATDPGEFIFFEIRGGTVVGLPRTAPAFTKVVTEIFLLGQNRPNPFNPDTWIPYQLADDLDVTIRIYNAVGKLVRTLDIGHKPAGPYISKDKAAHWDGKNEAGEHVASGVYFYTIQAGDFTATKKMIVTR